MKRSREVQDMLDHMTKTAFGRSNTEAGQQQICVSCGQPATEFKDEVSAREYQISRMCQTCQDKVFCCTCDDPDIECPVHNKSSEPNERLSFDVFKTDDASGKTLMPNKWYYREYFHDNQEGVINGPFDSEDEAVADATGS